MWFTELPAPIVIAHRGSSSHAPENTLAAFKLAIQQGADAIELDTMLAGDGNVVVIHDHTVDRTTQFKGQVKDYSSLELRKMDAGGHFDIEFVGEPIPTLDEVFQTIGQLTILNIELKNYFSVNDDLPEKVAQLIKHHKLQHRIIFSSFNPIALARINRLIPEAPIGLLILPGFIGSLTRNLVSQFFSYNSLHPALVDVTPILVKDTHRLGRKIFPFVVNRKEDMEKLLKMNVDGIITDDPLLAHQVLRTVLA